MKRQVGSDSVLSVRTPVSWQVMADLLLSASLGEILIQPSLELMGACSPKEVLLMTLLLSRMETGALVCVPQTSHKDNLSLFIIATD